jgi:hypothetical protein
MKVSITDILSSQVQEITESEDRGKVSHAYCFLLYGASPTDQMIANALSVGHSMRFSKYPRVMMITEDVPDEAVNILSECGVFTRVVKVEYIKAHRSLFKKDWFRDVFTKFHIFNLTEYSRVMFLDIDMVIRDVSAMDDLFDLPCNFGAMENSKTPDAGSMWLQHGSEMGNDCKLINAGLILVRPNSLLFETLVSDILSDSSDHVPGMTPEQFYLARVMGKHFHHISQKYNFEVQLHGGVPRTDLWETLCFEEIVCFHFSGGSALSRIVDLGNREWGCQTEKRSILSVWKQEIDSETRKLANERARLAFGLWAFHFAQACKTVRSRKCNLGRFTDLIWYGCKRTGETKPDQLFVGDSYNDKLIVVRNDGSGSVIAVSEHSYEFSIVPENIGS